MKKIEYRCPYCGSNEVLQDAFRHMNTGEVSTFDNKTCDNCGMDFDEAAEVEVEAEVDPIEAYYVDRNSSGLSPLEARP